MIRDFYPYVTAAQKQRYQDTLQVILNQYLTPIDLLEFCCLSFRSCQTDCILKLFRLQDLTTKLTAAGQVKDLSLGEFVESQLAATVSQHQADATDDHAAQLRRFVETRNVNVQREVDAVKLRLRKKVVGEKLRALYLKEQKLQFYEEKDFVNERDLDSEGNFVEELDPADPEADAYVEPVEVKRKYLRRYPKLIKDSGHLN